MIDTIGDPNNEDLNPNIYAKKEENKSSKNFMKEKFLSLIKTQNGSRLLQNSLANRPYEFLKNILVEMKDNLSELLIDPYANYFCPKFYGLLQLDDRILFLNQVFKKIYLFIYFFKKDKKQNKFDRNQQYRHLSFAANN